MDESLLFFFGIGFIIGIYILRIYIKEGEETTRKELSESICTRHSWSYDHLGNLTCIRCSKTAKADSENGEEK